MSDSTPKNTNEVGSQINKVAHLLWNGPQTDRATDLGRSLGMSQCFITIALFGFSKKKIIYLQGLNTRFYKRVA